MNKLPDSNVEHLTEMQKYVTQQQGTEPPFTGKLLHNEREGTYYCICCNHPLFSSNSKFDAGCGWPSFSAPEVRGAIRYLDDFSNNMHRIEIRCANCNAHLGHVFPDELPASGERYCVNSAALSFIDKVSGESTKG